MSDQPYMEDPTEIQFWMKIYELRTPFISDESPDAAIEAADRAVAALRERTRKPKPKMQTKQWLRRDIPNTPAKRGDPVIVQSESNANEEVLVLHLESRTKFAVRVSHLTTKGKF